MLPATLLVASLYLVLFKTFSSFDPDRCLEYTYESTLPVIVLLRYIQIINFFPTRQVKLSRFLTIHINLQNIFEVNDQILLYSKNYTHSYNISATT
jgi:hypothetical protein